MVQTLVYGSLPQVVCHRVSLAYEAMLAASPYLRCSPIAIDQPWSMKESKIERRVRSQYVIEQNLADGVGRGEQTVCVGPAIRNEASAIQTRTWEVKMETARISAAEQDLEISVQGGCQDPLRDVRARTAMVENANCGLRGRGCHSQSYRDSCSVLTVPGLALMTQRRTKFYLW